MYNIEDDGHRQGNSPKQVLQWVVDKLRNDILEGRIVAGEWLRQEKFAKELGVSQTPVREALKQLAAEGLVEHAPYRGIRVITFTADDVEDLYEGRKYEEGRAARFAALNISNGEIEELQQLHKAMLACETPKDLEQYRELNRRFHLLIIHASRRPYLIRSLGQFWATFPSMLWGRIPGVAKVSAPGRDEPDAAEHQAIVDALAARNAGAAEAALKSHIEAAGQALVKAMKAAR